MSIDDVNILFSWICGEDEAEFESLKKDVADGNEKAKIELAALNVENAENVAENIDFLEKAAQKNDVGANLFLGVIYSEGIAENGSTENPLVIIPRDWEKSNSYLEKAIALGSLLAYKIRGVHTFLHCCCSNSYYDDESSATVSRKDFLDGEKYLLEFIALKDDENLDEDRKSFVRENFALFASWLSALYGSENPASPFYDAEKSREWAEKSESVQLAEKQNGETSCK